MANGNAPSLADMFNSIEKLTRVLAAFGRGEARQTLGDIGNISPDKQGFGAFIGIHADIAASAGGTDVTLDTNPDYEVAIHELRATCEVGTAEATSTGTGSYSGMHCSVGIKDADSQRAMTYSKDPCAGNAGMGGGVDIALLGANGGHPVKLPVPYVFRSANGSSTITVTFATSSGWPGTRRVGVGLVATYKRRGVNGAAV